MIRKLGIKAAMRILFVNAPPDFAVTLGPLPVDVELCILDADDDVQLDVIVFFAEQESDVRAQFSQLAKMLVPAGGLWIAWPKKTSGMTTDLSDDRVRQLGLDHRLVDNKVCSIDSTWSAQRFVMRLKNRP